MSDKYDIATGIAIACTVIGSILVLIGWLISLEPIPRYIGIALTTLGAISGLYLVYDYIKSSRDDKNVGANKDAGTDE